MNRRDFLHCAAVLTTLTAARSAGSSILSEPSGIQPISGDVFLSPDGDDAQSGSQANPLRTLVAAQAAVRRIKSRSPGPITVYLRAGTYYLDDTLVFTAQDSGEPEAPVLYCSYPGERVILSGGTRLALRWKPYRDGIMMAAVPPGTQTDQLFINGSRQILARYPNYDPTAGPLSGTSPEAFGQERAKRWANPQGGYIHALHGSLWGDMHFRISGKDAEGNVIYEGGWQNNRPAPMHKQYRFVENIFEELDSPGEWFLDPAKSILYFYPPSDLDLSNATVEIVRLKHLVEFRGTEQLPVRSIGLSGFTLRHAARTFMETREPLLRSDWRIYRGGALLFDGTEDCRIDRCFLDQLGGNGLFVSNYNRRISISRCHIADAGASGVCFVGNPTAVRNSLFSYQDRLALANLDRTPGPKTNQYPKDCMVEDSLIYRTGAVEKQTSPIEIAMAASITVRHCSVYDVPRAGINIGDGTWGGHHIEYCDVFDTVKETGDHGSYNSWGRDRWWGLTGVDLDTVLDSDLSRLPTLDTVKPIVLANSRWSCEHGWDIDLDDGSSNYRIYNNLCLNGGLKLREGFFRDCKNNILVNNTVHQHVWYNDSHDVISNNIVFTPYRPIRMREWTKEIDFNLLHEAGRKSVEPAEDLQKISGQDAHSIVADARFVNPSTGDYRASEGSPAFAIGFVNFDMDSFGVQDPELKGLARRPKFIYKELPSTLVRNGTNAARQWLGATVRDLRGLGEVSASGAPGETGVLVVSVASGAAAAALQPNDLILAVKIDDLPEVPIRSVADLLMSTAHLTAKESLTIGILRHQQRERVKVGSVSIAPSQH
jgi:Right handed beta helix region